MTRERAHSAWKSAEAIKTISDRVIGIGPFGIGLDGLLTWVPVAGTVYSVGGALFLLAEALRAGAKPMTLMRMAAYLVVDSGSSAVPVLGSAVDFFWQGHLMAATALQKDIEDRHGAPADVPLKKRARKKAGSKFAH
ncbi:MAG: DUF4112 domain-containing protein [Caulobacteraceae bacterium]|nr:DUF4112 domain-containing protein [Caulobacter sp.]RYF89359.1 MAG: DUF4112 domain-containing protein [Caulobacteraceae bacterium]